MSAEPLAIPPPSSRNPQDRLIVALDLPTAAAALSLVDRLDGLCRWFKVGLELYLGAGPGIVHTLRERGFNVFLDLKLHDIPNTVSAAIHALSSSSATLLTVHAAGGSAMLKAAAEAAARHPNAPKLLAVTVLTSMDAALLRGIGIDVEPADQVLRLARLAQAAGVSGMICSPQEVALLRSNLGPQSLLIVPGIRPLGGSPGDQRRTATPAETLRAGASMLVIGRPITQHEDPAAATHAILAEMSTV